MLLICYDTSRAQKYLFTHYDIENGLPQSQVSRITQDSKNRLWLATLGGGCVFDGKEFKAYTKDEGMSSNYIIRTFADKNERIWFAGTSGLCYLKDGKIHQYTMPPNRVQNRVSNIVQDNFGRVIVHVDGNIYEARDGRMFKIAKPGDGKRSITAVATDSQGQLYAAVIYTGVFKLNRQKQWEMLLPFKSEESGSVVFQILPDRLHAGDLFLLAFKNIYKVTAGVLSKLNIPANRTFFGLEQDGRGRLWLATNAGAYCYNGIKPFSFNAKNGFTDNAVLHIFNDAENNLWFGTNGDGLFKYEGDNYASFDATQGLGPISAVMAIARDSAGNILLGTDGSGLFKYDGAKLTKLWEAPPDKAFALQIESLYTQPNGDVLIGTRLGGLWIYNGHDFKIVPNTYFTSASSILVDRKGTRFNTGPTGCFYYNGDVRTQISGVNAFSNSLLEVGGDSILIGGQLGPQLLVNKQVDTHFNILKNVMIYCIAKDGGNILFGTGEGGLFVYNFKEKQLKHYNKKTGLSSNVIYNIVADARHNLWLGTEKGIFEMKRKAGTDYVPADNQTYQDRVFEANQNSVLLYGNQLWMGGSKALSVFNIAEKNDHRLPVMVLKSARFIQSDQEKDNSTQHARKYEQELPNGGSLAFDQSHLTISYLGVYLKAPQTVRYQYKMIGLDAEYSDPVDYTTVEYPALPPGSYTFSVRSFINGSRDRGKPIEFSFSVTPPFYQTIPFKLGVLLAIVLIVSGLQTFIQRRKNQNVLLMDAIKKEEQQKIRIQTSEDFHDDLGNKLTRINILADMLNARIDAEDSDKHGLVNQIKQNVAGVYSGTREILWALDPKSDNLYDVLIHIKDFGSELFMDTHITFNFNDISESWENIKLTMEYSRNLNMIFKELLNNALKHAASSAVSIKAKVSDTRLVVMELDDNGTGFDPGVKRKGHGINNINKRVARLGGTAKFSTAGDTGTTVLLRFQL